MKTPKHTPGPWTVEERRGNQGEFVLSSRGRPFGSFIGWVADGVTTYEEDVANARLSAMAPELLEALEILLGGIEAREKRTGIIQMGKDVADARLVLSKATQP